MAPSFTHRAAARAIVWAQPLSRPVHPVLHGRRGAWLAICGTHSHWSDGVGIATVPAHSPSLAWLQGRLIDHLRNTQSVGLEDLQALVLDEADRLLQMGFAEEVCPSLPGLQPAPLTMHPGTAPCLTVWTPRVFYAPCLIVMTPCIDCGNQCRC